MSSMSLKRMRVLDLAAVKTRAHAAANRASLYRPAETVPPALHSRAPRAGSEKTRGLQQPLPRRRAGTPSRRAGARSSPAGFRSGSRPRAARPISLRARRDRIPRAVRAGSDSSGDWHGRAASARLRGSPRKSTAPDEVRLAAPGRATRRGGHGIAAAPSRRWFPRCRVSPRYRGRATARSRRRSRSRPLSGMICPTKITRPGMLAVRVDGG